MEIIGSPSLTFFNPHVFVLSCSRIVIGQSLSAAILTLPNSRVVRHLTRVNAQSPVRLEELGSIPKPSKDIFPRKVQNFNIFFVLAIAIDRSCWLLTHMVHSHKPKLPSVAPESSTTPVDLIGHSTAAEACSLQSSKFS